MAWKFKKTVKTGPIQTTITKNGVGNSIGFLGFRVGVTAENKKYFSFGLKGTGLYFIKYF